MKQKNTAGNHTDCLPYKKIGLKLKLFEFFFVVLLWLIYALNSIPNGTFEPIFPPIILFLKIFVAEKVAKSPAG